MYYVSPLFLLTHGLKIAMDLISLIYTANGSDEIKSSTNSSAFTVVVCTLI